MNDKPLVPEPPKEKVVISDEDKGRMEEWIAFLTQLSGRIKLLRTNESEFEGFLDKAEKTLRHVRTIEDDRQIIDWPLEENVAFIIRINSSETGSILETFDWNDLYFFCFGDYAFSLSHFTWDGDAEAGDWATTYSLSSYSTPCLEWNFIKKLIVDRVTELEKRVPQLRSKK